MNQFNGSTVQVTGTSDGSTAQRVGLDQDGIGMLMSILSNQYVDKHGAVLREYFCNGWDSHLQSGNTDKPVLVTLPTDLQPSLLIQDSGLGLARDEMLSIFGTYGTSTKRANRGEGGVPPTGGFGIGSKSAWTMGQQFIVTGVKDGRKTVALFALDSEGVGTCDIIKEVDTDEHNGVLISLAVPDVEAMNETAARFFETVDRGTVLVNGVEPTPIFESMTKINDSTYVRNNHAGNLYVVMGQVSYLVDASVLRAVSKRLADTDAASLSESLAAWNSYTSVYFRVDMDTVTVHPSRERLRDTNTTVTTLARLVTDLSSDLTTSIQASVDAAPSYYVAARVVEDAIDNLGEFRVSRKALRFAGLKVPKTATVDMFHAFLTTKSWRSSAKIVATDSAPKTLEIGQAEKSLTVTGVSEADRGKVTRYLKRFLTENETYSDVETVFITDQPWGAHGWFAFGTENGARTMTLEEFKAEIRAMRVSTTRTVNEASYTVGWDVPADRDPGYRDLLSDIISWGKDLIIFDSRSHVRGFSKTVLDDSYTPVVLLGTQSEAALRKRVAEDGTVSVFDGNWKDLVKDEAAKRFSVTDAEKDALSADAWLAEATDYRGAHWATDLLDALGGREVVTSTRLLAIVDEIELARLIAEDITEERRREITDLIPYVGETDLPTYPATLPEEHEAFPLLNRVSSLAYYTKRDEDLAADVLEYVNSKA